MAGNFLNQLHPPEEAPLSKDNTSEYQVRLELERSIKNLKDLYPYSDDDVSAVNSDLISILSLEHWNEKLQRARGSLPLKAVDSYRDASKQHSLIGASNTTMAIAAMKRGFDAVVSYAIEKEHLSEDITIDSSTKAVYREFRKTSENCINTLITLMEKVEINFDEIDATVRPLLLVTTRLGAKKLKNKCEKLISFCKKKDKNGCNTVQTEIEAEHCRVRFPFETIFELQNLIQLVETMMERAESGIYAP